MNPFNRMRNNLVLYAFSFLDEGSLRNVAHVSRELRAIACKLLWQETTLARFLSIIPTRLLNALGENCPVEALIINDKLTGKEWETVRLVSKCIHSLKIQSPLSSRDGPGNTFFYTSLVVTNPEVGLFPNLRKLSLTLTHLFLTCTPFLLQLISPQLRELYITIRPNSVSAAAELYPLLYIILSMLPKCCPHLTVLSLLFGCSDTGDEANITATALRAVKAIADDNLKVLVISSACLPFDPGDGVLQSLQYLETLRIGCSRLSIVSRFIGVTKPTNVRDLAILDIPMDTSSLELDTFFCNVAGNFPRLERLSLRTDSPSHEEYDDDSDGEIPLVPLSASLFSPLLGSPTLRRISMPRDGFGWTSEVIAGVMKLLTNITIDTDSVPHE